MRNIFMWAKEKGYENFFTSLQGEPSPFGYNLAKFLVQSRIKKQLGLDRVEKLYFGAAPLREKTRMFFVSLDMPLANTYGLSETSAAATIQDFPNISLDKAGKPLPGTFLKIYNPDENGIGEICMKGRNIFMGYLKNP
jgi:long-chain-fatty-acid--CoA ligase ACSBG